MLCELRHGPRGREMKRAPLALTQVDQTGVFEGYASVFGVIDLGRDVVLPGAFAQSLAQRPAADVKLLWQHKTSEPIGAWLSIIEDSRGLKVRGKLNLAVARAREVLSLMREGAVDGLSIGFHTRQSSKDPRTGVRSLREIDLWEISIVTFPMLPQARVTAVKRFIGAAEWRSQLARLRWRISALALEAKFISARKDLVVEGDGSGDSATGASTGAPGAGNWQNQPRAPAGTPEGGQWVSGEAANDNHTSGITDTNIVSDANPEGVIEGQQYAANTRRPGGTTSRMIAGEVVEVTPAQEARLAASETQANLAQSRVQSLDPTWKPEPAIFGGVEGQIARNNDVRSQAEARYRELQTMGIVPGQFARESIEARGASRSFTEAEREAGNALGAKFGCHTCGTKEPGTSSGNFILDHQAPSALNVFGELQRLYPQCSSCSTRQGGYVNGLILRRNRP